MPFYLLYIFLWYSPVEITSPLNDCLLFTILIITNISRIIIKIDLTIKKYNLYYYSDLFIFLKLVFIHKKNCLRARYGR